jgi:adenylosuccinate lyase
MLALTQTGVEREDAYKYVQRNAMQVWEKGADFLKLLQADKDVISKLPAPKLAELFDLKYHTKHVETIFKRVFNS